MPYYELTARSNFKYRSLNRISGPEVEPVTLTEAKAHLRIDSDFVQDDDYLQSLITAARFNVEAVIDRTLIRSKWQIKFDYFPSWDIPLQRPPIAFGDIVVTYVPAQSPGTTVTLTGYRVDRDSTPAVIRPEWNGTWPSARGAENDVTVTYWAGWDGPSQCPKPAKHAILLMLGHWYANREAVVAGGMSPVPMAVDSLLGSVNWGQYR